MKHAEGQAPYARKRFDWKKAVSADPFLSRGTKLLATCLCDTYVNKHTGCCWPKNRTLAKRLAVNERSIQRYLRQLENACYLETVDLPNIRRAYRICFPATKGDSNHDNLSPPATTRRSHEGDKAVTPYKNQGKNNEKKDSFVAGNMPCVSVSDQETAALAEWERWLVRETEFEVGKVFQLLRTASGHMLPGRYPLPERTSLYRCYFEEVWNSGGLCLPGKR